MRAIARRSRLCDSSVPIVNNLLTIVNRYVHGVKYRLMIVNERITKIRLHKGLTMKALALRSGISHAALSRLEGGSRNLPRVDTLQKLACAFDVSMDYLLGQVDADLELNAALARQSLEIYLRGARVSFRERDILVRIASEDSAPQKCEDWEKLRRNLAISRSLSQPL